MKRQIVEILHSINGGIKYDEQKTPHWILSYNIVEDGKIIARKKTVDGILTEIEDVWEEVESRPESTSPHTQFVGICKETFKRDSDYAKQWCFIAILQRLLIDNLNPKGNVSIWQEKIGDKIRTYGQCEVWKKY